MQILSYPIGLLIGLFPITVDLGPTRAPAHLLLDARPVCEVTERSPGCTIDLGPDPRVHLLELLRTDASGRVTERVARWINRPGIEPEVLVAGGCDGKTLVCDFGLTWAHPEKLDPKKLVLQLDGATRWEKVAHEAKFPLAKGSKPQVVSCDVEFPDGSRATYTRALYAFNPEEAQASLAAIPVIPGPDAGSSEALAARLKEAGLPVRTVEETEPEVTFVMDAHALDRMLETSVDAAGRRQKVWPAHGSRAFEKVHVVFPDESLPANVLGLERLGSVVPADRRPSTLSRYADAVAAAGYALGASPRRRAVVLVLSGFERPNGSSFTAAQARAYLAEVMVPLVVWRIGDVEAPEWPVGRALYRRSDVLAALDDLREEVGRQRILWLEGFHDTRYLGRWLVPGVALAGRDPAAASVVDAPPPSIAPGKVPSLGPDGGPVHALAVAIDGDVVYAGTHGGVFRSRDRGDRWEPASVGLPIAPVRCLAVSTPDVVYAGTEAGLFASADRGGRWKRTAGGLGAAPVASIALDPGSPRVLFVGTTGRGVLRSDDAGETMLATTLGHGDVRGLVVDPKSRTIVAATEDGVFRSADRGLTWTAAGLLPARALALVLDPGGALVAATAGGGLWSSADAGATWQVAGLRGTVLTSVGFGPAGSRLLLAGSPDGIFVSRNGGGAWKLARVGAIEALVAGAGAPLAASSRGVLRRAEASGAWREENAGLSASVVSSVAGARSADGMLYAASSGGLRRRASGGESEWAAVPGIPEGVVPEAVVALTNPGGDLCIGTTGGIGRSEESGTVWSFAATHAAFQLALDPARPDLVLAAARVGVLKSEDGGRRWSLAADGMEKTFALQIGHDPADPATFYAATAGSGVYRTVDAARTWKPGGAELVRRIVRSVAVDGGRRETVYAGTDSGVFRSEDGGADWSPSSEGLPRAPVYALVADPRSTGVVFAGTAQGLFRSDDGGARWEAFPAGGLPAAVISLWLDPGATTLVAGSLGAGVFVVPLAAPPVPAR